MVKSILVPNVNYSEIRALEPEDKKYEASIYEANIMGKDIIIALGQGKYSYIDDNIVYYPIYFVKNQRVDTQIGVYEVLANRVPNILDEDGDIDIEELGEPLLYGFVNSELLTDDVSNVDDKPVEDDKDEDDKDEDDKDEDEDEDDKDEDDKDEGDDDEDYGFAPLSEQTEEDAKRESKSFDKKKSTQWIQSFLHNLNYDIIENDGSGDCLFYTIRDGLSKVGKRVTVPELRKILADNANEEIFENFKFQYESVLKEKTNLTEEIKEIAKLHKDLKKQLQEAKDRSVQSAIVAQAEELTDRHSIAKRERKTAMEILDEFKFMKGITTIEAFKAKIQTPDFWGETWSISTLERELNIKLILFSQEAYDSDDLDNVLQCGQLNDDILEKKGVFKPTHYIMCNFIGWHYELITYKERGAFTFKEIPYDVKKLIVTKCLERMAGPYYIIPDFKDFLSTLGQDVDIPVEPELSSDLYSGTAVFQFNNRSAHKKPGKGVGETLGSEEPSTYIELASIPEWRKKLSNSWPQEFQVDGKSWQTVEHYYHGSKYKKENPEFYNKFSLDSGSDISRDPVIAKKAAGKANNQYRPANVMIDKDFLRGRNERELETAIKAKFTQNKELKRLLLATKKAKLLHFNRGKPPKISNDLMRVRQLLDTKSENIVNPNPLKLNTSLQKPKETPAIQPSVPSPAAPIVPTVKPAVKQNITETVVFNQPKKI